MHHQYTTAPSIVQFSSKIIQIGVGVNDGAGVVYSEMVVSVYLWCGYGSGQSGAVVEVVRS